MNTKEKNRTASENQKRSGTKKNSNQEKSAQKPVSSNQKLIGEDEEESEGQSASYEQPEEEPDVPNKGLDVGDNPDETRKKSPKMN